jgi:predicted alpha/beta-hydrolase family hydrolase
MRSGRALRKKGYDVFLPDFSLNGGKREVEIGFVLIPGALVDPLAYATIAAKFSDEGILVAVMNTEPQRLPTEKTGAGKVKVLTIMYDIIAGMSDGTNFGLATVKQWAVGGHSMGAFQAFEVIGDLKPGICKLVMWGIGKPDELAFDVNLHDATVDALVIVGSEDVFYQQLSEEDRNAFFRKLPKTRTTFLEIEGGNHSGFAHYGPHTFPLKDGERSITLDEQQDGVVAATITFLVGEDGSKLKKQ